MTFRTAETLCPNLKKPPLPSKIPGYAPETSYLVHPQMNYCQQVAVLWNCAYSSH